MSYNVSFIAAGRDKARIAEAMDKVPGIDTVEHDIVEACLNAGCHYLDTTGEQDWLITCDEEYWSWSRT